MAIIKKVEFPKKIILVFVFLFHSFTMIFAQDQIMSLIKKGKLLKTYARGDYIVFLDNFKEWQYGILDKVWKDSFRIKPYILHYVRQPFLNNGFEKLDTISYNFSYYSLKDVFAMPKPGIVIQDIDGANNHQINRDAGWVHFYWIQGGWLFRAIGLGHASLNIFNSLIKNQPINLRALGFATGLFLFGEFLKYHYKPYLRISRKYYLKIF